MGTGSAPGASIHGPTMPKNFQGYALGVSGWIGLKEPVWEAAFLELRPARACRHQLVRRGMADEMWEAEMSGIPLGCTGPAEPPGLTPMSSGKAGAEGQQALRAPPVLPLREGDLTYTVPKTQPRKWSFLLGRQGYRKSENSALGDSRAFENGTEELGSLPWR